MKLLSAGILIAAICSLLPAIASAQAASPAGQMIQFPNGNEQVQGFLAMPEKPGRYPALVAIHEWWGLTDWVREQAEKLAQQGYIVLAVDLYQGKVTSDPDQALQLTEQMPRDRAVGDLVAAFAWLNARKDVDRDHIGAIGWSMGGGLALQLAIHEPRLAACVVNYGDLPTDPGDILQIYAPVLGIFGADDRGITPKDVQEFEKTMQSMRHVFDVKIYDGAGHAFENPANTATYNPDAAADAWARTIAFLSKTMR